MRAFLVLLCALSLTSRARSEPSERGDRAKVLLLDPRAPALSGRLREEIESLGLEVETIEQLSPEESLEARAREAGAVAAIRVTDAGPRAVEMTIVDRSTGKTVSRRLALATPGDPAAAELVATRTVELLRASLMELSAAHPPRGDVPVRAEVEALAPPRPTEPASARLAVAVGPALLYSPDLTASAAGFASLSIMSAYRFGATLAVQVPITPSRISTVEGEIELMVSEYRVGGALDLLPLSSRVGARFQVGVALTRLAFKGEASSPYFGTQDDALAWSPWLGVGVRARLAANVSAFGELTAALAYPRTVIRSAGRELTTWGRPRLTGAAGLELSWP